MTVAPVPRGPVRPPQYYKNLYDEAKKKKNSTQQAKTEKKKKQKEMDDVKKMTAAPRCVCTPHPLPPHCCGLTHSHMPMTPTATCALLPHVCV